MNQARTESVDLVFVYAHVSDSEAKHDPCTAVLM
jgi:hypothetical protein